VRVQLKIIGIAAAMANCYTTTPMPFEL